MCDSRFKQKVRTRLAFGITQIILKVYNSLMGKLTCFANNSGSLHIHDFWKKYHEVHVSLRCTSSSKSLKETQKLPLALRLPSCELMVYIDIWLIHLQKEGISKHERKLCNCFGQLLNMECCYCLWSLHTLDISEFSSSFNDCVAI